MNNRPILCCGTKDGEVYLYDIEWEIEMDHNYGLNMKKLHPPETSDKTYHSLRHQWTWNEKGRAHDSTKCYCVGQGKGKTTIGNATFNQTRDSKLSLSRGALLPFKQESSPLRLRL
jgi:hypothetical protein